MLVERPSCWRGLDSAGKLVKLLIGFFQVTDTGLSRDNGAKYDCDATRHDN